jgi:3-hydroxybutyryl-CoA dehydrogenase
LTVEISKIVIVGETTLGKKIEALCSKAGIQVAILAPSATAPWQPDLVIEAIDGDAKARKKVLQDWGKHQKNALLATTAAGGITEMAGGTGLGERLLGMYFMSNPLEDKTLVQVVKGFETSPDAIAAAKKAAEKMGVVAVVVEDVAGLIVDRVMASVINEAAYMLQTKLASMEDINRVPKACLNWPMGPFEFADHIGIDNVVATLDAATKDGPQFLPSLLLRQMVAAGRLGKKTGRGFYEYPAGKGKQE